MSPHIFEVGLKVNTKVYLDVLKCVDPLVQSDGRLQTLGVAAGLGAGIQVQIDPGLATEGLLQLCTLFSLAPPPPTWTHWTTLFGHTSRTSPTWPPTTLSKPDRCHPPSIRRAPARRLWKRHAPSSRSVSRQWLRLRAATLNRCQLYYIIKLPELIFSMKSFKIKLVVLFSLGRQFYRSTLYQKKFKLKGLQYNSTKIRERREKSLGKWGHQRLKRIE